MATSPTCIIAYTGEDDRYRTVRSAAIDTARSSEARLILYDIDAAQMFAAPLPTEWSGEGDRDQFDDMLTADDLERAGRHSLAEQVNEARAAGVEAFGWLPSKKGAEALAEYAEQHGADLVMVPDGMEHPGLLDRLRGNTAEKVAEKAPAAVAVVDESGAIHYS